MREERLSVREAVLFLRRKGEGSGDGYGVGGVGGIVGAVVRRP